MGKVIKAIKNLFNKRKQQKQAKDNAKRLAASSQDKMNQTVGGKAGTCKKPTPKDLQSIVMPSKGLSK